MVLEARELQEWTRRLTAPLARRRPAPIKVEASAGAGFHLRLYSSPSRILHLCLTESAETPEALVRTRTAAVCTFGDRPADGEERVWIRSIAAALERIEQLPEWRAFLHQACRQESPDRSRRMTSGGELLLRVSNRCNARCDFCNAKGTPPDLVLDGDAVRERLRGAARGRPVSFTGGEPTLLPDLREWIALAREEGAVQVGLQSNGVRLSRRPLVRDLKAAGLDHVFLSLHSADAGMHDALLGLHNAHRRLTRAVELCLEASLAVGLNCVLTTRNLEGAVTLVEHVAERFGAGGTYVVFSLVAPEGAALEHLELLPRPPQAARVLAAALDRAEELSLTVRIPGLCGVPLCVLPGYEEHFDELYDPEPPRIATRSYLAECQECRHRPRCSGFWTRYLELFGPEGIGP